VPYLNTSTSSDEQQHRLRRAPSAPIFSRYSAHAASPASSQGRSPAATDLYAANARPPQHHHHPRFSVTEKSSADLLGQRFDSAAVISSFNAVPYSTDPLPAQREGAQPAAGIQPHSDPSLHRSSAHFHPRQLVHAHTTGHSLAQANPAVGLEQSLAATGRRMEDLGGLKSPRQRYSDEVKENKMLKKKSGFSSFFNLSSPRRPAISAPENPVHVTHVGYDQETGEFTVSQLSPRNLQP
jgi:p21-activated kinase 1